MKVFQFSYLQAFLTNSVSENLKRYNSIFFSGGGGGGGGGWFGFISSMLEMIFNEKTKIEN